VFPRSIVVVAATAATAGTIAATAATAATIAATAAVVVSLLASEDILPEHPQSVVVASNI
jgi:hypothetical protein